MDLNPVFNLLSIILINHQTNELQHFGKVQLRYY
jgi:hypothetical protein